MTLKKREAKRRKALQLFLKRRSGIAEWWMFMGCLMYDDTGKEWKP